MFVFRMGAVMRLVGFYRCVRSASTNVSLTVTRVFPTFHVFGTLAMGSVDGDPIRNAAKDGTKSMKFYSVVYMCLRYNVSLRTFCGDVNIIHIFVSYVNEKEANRNDVGVAIRNVGRKRLRIVQISAKYIRRGVRNAKAVAWNFRYEVLFTWFASRDFYALFRDYEYALTSRMASVSKLEAGLNGSHVTYLSGDNIKETNVSYFLSGGSAFIYHIFRNVCFYTRFCRFFNNKTNVPCRKSYNFRKVRELGRFINFFYVRFRRVFQFPIVSSILNMVYKRIIGCFCRVKINAFGL